jgi:hypothetical protein
MAIPTGRLEGVPKGNRDRAFGRISKSLSSTWVYDSRKDVTTSILEVRAKVNPPRGADLPLILPEKSMVLRSAAGSWPKQLPPSASELLEEAEWQKVREADLRLNGLPGSPPSTAPAAVPESDLQNRIETDKSPRNLSQSNSSIVPNAAITVPASHDTPTAAANMSSPSKAHNQTQPVRASTTSQPKQLTYSIRPRTGASFDPNAVRWEDRHHIGIRNEVGFTIYSFPCL